jgi:CAAX protease family protein
MASSSSRIGLARALGPPHSDTRSVVWALLLYYSTAYAVTWLFWLTLVASKKGWIRPLSAPLFYNIAVLGPLIAAVLVTWQRDGKSGLRQLAAQVTRFHVGLKWYAAALGIFPAAFAGGIAITLLKGYHGPLVTPDHSNWDQPLWAVFVLMPIFVLFEEIGWRGSALPLFEKKFNPVVASLILGFLLACWHLPSFWMPRSPHQGVPFLGFLELILLWSLIATWIYNHTGSVFLTWLLHLSSNFTFIFAPRPIDRALPGFVNLLLLGACVTVLLRGGMRNGLRVS